MILAAVTDLMFASRIRGAASSVGADLRFARTLEDALDVARRLRPTVLLLDLNDRSFDPLDLIAGVKGDPEASATRIVGFVSHVQADVIAAARRAGIDEILARSAFVARLPDLLR